MAEKNLLRDLIDKETGSLAVYLVFKARKSAVTIEEYIATAQIQGQSLETIRDTLLSDLLNNGRIFSEFRTAIKATANGSINRLRDAGEFAEFGVDLKYRWAAVLIKTCPDCLARHYGGADTSGNVWDGKPKTWAEWEAIGLPRTGVTVCKQNCRCMLIPEEFSVKEPIKREKRN